MRSMLSKSGIGVLAFVLLAALAGLPPVAPAVAQTNAPATVAPLAQTTIRALQEALNKQGITVAVDGVMGEATRAAIRKYQTQHHLPVTGEPDKATLDKLGVAVAESGAPAGAPTPQAQAPMGGMMGQGMMGSGPMGPGMMDSGMMGSDMTSHMAHMMQMMGGQMGGGQMGGGMMGGQGGQPGGMAGMGMGGGMMGGQTGGQMGGQMGGMGMRPGAMMGMGRMHGSSGGMGMMPGLIYGTPSGELTTDRVSKIVDGLLAWHGNPRLKLGKVAEDGGEIVAEIVTQDGSLVQKLAFNRHPGVGRQVP